MALLTLAALKAALSVTGTARDAELAALIADATAQIKAYLGYDPEQTSYTEFADGTGGADLALAAPPLPVTITGVWEDRDRAFGSDTALTAGTHYLQRTLGGAGLGELERLNAVWPFVVRREAGRLSGSPRPAAGTVKVTYTAATAGVLAVASVCCLWECKAGSNAGATGVGLVTSDAMDGGAVSVNPAGRPRPRPDSADGFVSPLVAPKLAPFARIKTAR